MAIAWQRCSRLEPEGGIFNQQHAGETGELLHRGAREEKESHKR